VRRNRLNKRAPFWMIGLLIGIVLVVIAGWMILNGDGSSRGGIQTVQVDGISIPAKAGEDYIQVNRDGIWQNVLIKGVNMGIAKPGHFPGEAAITKEEYARWFRQIGEMHANAVRVYTLHPPAFYEALYEYNRKAKEPVMLLQGVWVDEEKLLSSGDAFSADVNDELRQEIRDIVDVIHGKAVIPAKAGHASGTYKADVSAYVLGWILGIEWDPETVVSTNRKHEGTTQFNGSYFQTEQASPFEIWLARMMDETAEYETSTYKWQRPFSFTNWVTTDPLRHPSEPSPNEDLVSVDPNKIKAKPSLVAGYFASYHVYPYYPEFLNYDKKYWAYKDFRGEANGYAGYLHDLKKAHGMPVLIAEFGVPSSRGMTHRNVNGLNQGFLSESEQGSIDARLFEDIYHEGMAGGLAFTWQDEWFKRTWNNMDIDNPDRRPFWSNAQTSEQNFGLLGFDPNEQGALLQVDGKTDDWTKAGIVSMELANVPPYRSRDGWNAQYRVDRFAASADEKYVIFRLDFGKDGKPFDWNRVNAMILLDTKPNQGERAVPGDGGLSGESGFDFVIDLAGPTSSRVWVDSYYDPFYFQYGHLLNMIPAKTYAGTPNNGRFHTVQLAVNKAFTLPETGERLPFDAYETGLLRFGNGNPLSEHYDSLTDVSMNETDHVLEVRIPWQLLNVKDPSTREIMGDLWKNGLEGKETVSGFKAAVVTYKPNRNHDETAEYGLGHGEVAYTYPPATADGKLLEANLLPVGWEPWEQPRYHERLKASYYIMKDLFGRMHLE